MAADLGSIRRGRHGVMPRFDKRLAVGDVQMPSGSVFTVTAGEDGAALQTSLAQVTSPKGHGDSLTRRSPTPPK